MNEREITLKLKVTEVRALHACLSNALGAFREATGSREDPPAYYARLERVQRLVADGLAYLQPVRMG